MKIRLLSLGVLIVLVACSVLGRAESCPEHSDLEGLLRFLKDHKTNSLEANPECVDRAFGELGDNRKYTEELINLLDFERNYRKDHRVISRSARYPAISALATPEAVPDLVKAIEESDNELARTNAADAIDLVYRTCSLTAITLLEKETHKPDTGVVEQERLREAEQYIKEHLGARPCKANASSSE